MTRYISSIHFTKRLSLVLSWFIFTNVSSFAADESKPDIVVILADDMGYSDLGCMGSEIKTPNLDTLAKEGLRFIQFYNSMRCVPTRSSLLTGLYHHQAGLGGWVTRSERPGYLGHLSENSVTIAEVLRDKGYHTAMAGKWHVTPYDYSDKPDLHRASWPLQRGFDQFFGTLAGGGNYYNPKSLMRGNEFIQVDEHFYYTHAISDGAATFIDQAPKEKPLFLYIAHVAPHWPLHALPEDIAKYEGVYDVGWDSIRETRHARMKEIGILAPDTPLSPRDPKVRAWKDAPHKEWEARRMATYAAQIDSMDQGIGSVIEALKRRGRFDNTVIFFLSDNGSSDEVINGENTRHGTFAQGGTRPDVMPGSKDTYASGGKGWANASNTPFRQYKKWTQEGGIATPLIVHWPKGITAKGKIRHQVGHVIDIMATAIDLAGATYPSEHNDHEIISLEGISLRPSFTDHPLKREALYWEHQGQRAIRSGDWKLVGNHKNWKLYDLKADPIESQDLSAKHPDRAKSMAAMWEAWAKRSLVK
ncbi:arylsulfatase [Haloferula sp.]|uniref:arylsulfatase n=1 Tax=Haloferula sp. TaxID=2497595 RepID=UPI003C759937